MYSLGSMFTNTKAQLHVSVINVGHLQVVHAKLINKLYQRAWGVYRLWGGVGARSRFFRPFLRHQRNLSPTLSHNL